MMPVGPQKRVDEPGDEQNGQAGPPDSSAMLASLLNLRDDDPDLLVNRITLELAQNIIEGSIPPGAIVNSLDLARRFETSRTPIREALFVLEREGLIDIESRRRPRVAAPSPRQVAEIYRLRAHLHALVAAQVASVATPADLELLAAALERMAAAQREHDVDAYFWSNVAFHALAIATIGDSTIKRTLDGLGLQVLRLRHLGMSLPGRMDDSLDDHRRLLRAYRERDADLAAALSRSIILDALRALQSSPHVAAHAPD